jgi:signal peptidase II
MPQRTYRRLLLILAFLGFTADMASKYGVFNWLYRDGSFEGAHEIVPGAFRFQVQFDPNQEVKDCQLAKLNGPVAPRVNHGALFSLGGEFKADANKFFTGVSALAALGILIWGLFGSAKHDFWLTIALGLILGGTLGNLFDRIVFGGVRDFLYFYLINWPVFNVADCCLVVGAGLLLIQALFTKPKEAAPAAPPVA